MNRYRERKTLRESIGTFIELIEQGDELHKIQKSW